MAGVARSHTFLALLLASAASSQAQVGLVWFSLPRTSLNSQQPNVMMNNFQELQKEADNPLNCPRIERARKGDRVLIRYKGKL